MSSKWYFSFMKKYYLMNRKELYKGIEILMIKTPLFQFQWFTDCGSWFAYIIFGRNENSKWIRFSDCGTMSNFIKRFM